MLRKPPARFPPLAVAGIFPSPYIQCTVDCANAHIQFHRATAEDFFSADTALDIHETQSSRFPMAVVSTPDNSEACGMTRTTVKWRWYSSLCACFDPVGKEARKLRSHLSEKYKQNRLNGSGRETNEYPPSQICGLYCRKRLYQQSG